MIPKCSLNGYNAYMQFFGLLFMAFILVVVVVFYLQGRHNEITEKYNNINTTGNIDTTTLEFKRATDEGNRSTFPEDKYPGANYELIRDTTQTAGVGAVGASGVSISTAKPPPPRTTDIYKMRDCKVYFTDDIKSCDEQAESSTKTCSYTFNGWKEFDTYTDNNENTLTYPIKKYKPNASNTNELINAHFTSKCFKEFDNAGKGGARRFEYKENRLVKFDSKGENDNTEIDTNIFGGKKYTSIQFMNSGVPQDNLNNVIDSICSVKYNRIQVLNGKTFYKFILSGSGDNRVITSIDKLSLMDDQSGFNRIDTVAINDFAILGSHGLRFDDNNKLQIFINEAAINANMNVFKFTYVANLCINSQIKNYAMYPVNLRITDFLQFGAVARNAAKERVVEGIDTSLITNKGSYKGRNAGGSYIDYKKQILDDLEGRRQTEIASLKNASENRKAGYNATINSINNEMTAKYNEKNNFVVPNNTFVNVLNLYNRNGRRIFDYASGYKNNRLNNIVIPQGAEVIFMDNSDICMVFKNNTGNDQREYQFTIPEGDVYECDILVVGGGGSGGNDRGGGGGGGGVIYKQNITLNGSYTIRVGKGGLGPTSGTGGGTGTRGINGINTSISGTNITTITTIGGGGGGSCNSGSIRDGLSGGSGGGGSHYNGNGSGGTGTAGQGRNGGTGFEPGAGGGGGGAVNVGVNATSTNAGNGGVGLSNTITGSTVIYGSGGGGGGTSPLNFGGTIKLPGTGGSSGAGNGGGVNANGTNATVYGGGGGGGGYVDGATTKGGDGASGVVIIRYTSSSSSINFVRGTTTDANHDYKIGNYNGEFKVISSVSSVDTDYIKITSSGAISNPTGTASWNTGSDRRIKENIERASYDKCYDNINRLELNRFSYIEGFNTVNKDNKQLGFIAQEVYEVFPKSISSQGYYSDTLNIPDLLSIDVSQINYTLYGAVKKLIEINNEKDTCLKKLNNELKTIETILNIVEPPTSNMVVDDTTSNMVVDATTSNIVVDATTSNMVVDA